MARSALLILLLLAAHAVGQHSLPSPLEAADCEAAPAPNESPSAEVDRKGGHIATAKVFSQQRALTVDDVAQGRDLGQYEELTLVGPKPKTWIERTESPVLGR